MPDDPYRSPFEGPPILPDRPPEQTNSGPYDPFPPQASRPDRPSRQRSPASLGRRWWAIMAIVVGMCGAGVLAVLLLRDGGPMVAEVGYSDDQIRALQMACAARNLFYDDRGTCYLIGPQGLTAEEQAQYRVPAVLPEPAALPPTAVPDPTPTPVAPGAPTPAPTTPVPSRRPTVESPATAPDATDAVAGHAGTPVAPYVSLPPSASRDAEVHYVGSNDSGDVEVTVASLDNPIVLVLAAYDATNWSVLVEEGARVEYIVASGYERQRVFLRGGNDVRVYYSSHDEPGSFEFFHAVRDDSEPKYGIESTGEGWLCTDEVDEYRSESTYIETLRIIGQLTGKSPRGMQGGYHGSTFTVDDRSRDASLVATREGGYCYEGMTGQPPHGG